MLKISDMMQNIVFLLVLTVLAQRHICMRNTIERKDIGESAPNDHSLPSMNLMKEEKIGFYEDGISFGSPFINSLDDKTPEGPQISDAQAAFSAVQDHIPEEDCYEGLQFAGSTSQRADIVFTPFVYGQFEQNDAEQSEASSTLQYADVQAAHLKSDDTTISSSDISSYEGRNRWFTALSPSKRRGLVTYLQEQWGYSVDRQGYQSALKHARRHIHESRGRPFFADKPDMEVLRAIIETTRPMRPNVEEQRYILLTNRLVKEHKIPKKAASILVREFLVSSHAALVNDDDLVLFLAARHHEQEL